MSLPNRLKKRYFLCELISNNFSIIFEENENN